MNIVDVNNFALANGLNLSIIRGENVEISFRRLQILVKERDRFETKWKECLDAEQKISRAYVRLRHILGTDNQVFTDFDSLCKATEDAAKKLKKQPKETFVTHSAPGACPLCGSLTCSGNCFK